MKLRTQLLTRYWGYLVVAIAVAGFILRGLGVAVPVHSMTMMTASDAITYCLAIAQLIPVFLIALYIIDYSWLKSEESARTAAQLRTGYSQRAVWAILAGIVGEVIVLGGAIGLYSRLAAIATGTGIVIYVIGIISEPAVDRLTWDRNSKFPKFLRYRLLPIIVTVALIAFLCILFKVGISP